MKIFREKQARWQRAGSHKGLIQNKRSLSESDPFKNSVYCNGLDIEIDGLTDCLEVRSTGETVETEFGPIKMTPTLQRKLKRDDGENKAGGSLRKNPWSSFSRS